MSLRLHSTKGVNPKLTVCRRCGGEGTSIMLIGAHDHKFACGACGVVSYGSRTCIPCEGMTSGECEPIGEHERLPDAEFCETCTEELATHASIVMRGGVYFKCGECKNDGVIRPSDFATAVRRTHGGEHTSGPPYTAVGIEFDKCSEHKEG